MNITGAIVLYAVLWFLTLFVLLPIGQRSQQDAGEILPGTHAGAPHEPQLMRKAIWATLIAALLWGGCYWLIFGAGITREDVQSWDQILRR